MGFSIKNGSSTQVSTTNYWIQCQERIVGSNVKNESLNPASKMDHWIQSKERITNSSIKDGSSDPASVVCLVPLENTSVSFNYHYLDAALGLQRNVNPGDWGFRKLVTSSAQQGSPLPSFYVFSRSSQALYYWHQGEWLGMFLGKQYLLCRGATSIYIGTTYQERIIRSGIENRSSDSISKQIIGLKDRSLHGSRIEKRSSNLASRMDHRIWYQE